MTPDVDEGLGELTSSRRLPVPPDRVWRAFTTPDDVAAFWGGRHATVPADSVTMDLRPGGRFSLSTVGPDGSTHPLEFVYAELDEPRRIGLTEPATGIVTTIDIAPDGDHTLVTVHQRQGAGRATRSPGPAAWPGSSTNSRPSSPVRPRPRSLT